MKGNTLGQVEVVKNMFKKMIRNRKGTAEVIGSIMFIVILLFFFTNVYLWHDSATKEMNDLYVEKVNSPITVTIQSTSPFKLDVTNVGGEAATLSRLWIDEKSTVSGVPDTNHFSIDLQSKIVRPGTSLEIDLGSQYPSPPSMAVNFKVVTDVGNSASCAYLPT